jgi:hypothetical protein
VSASKPSWMPAGVGASPKTLAILGVLVVALGVTMWMNLRSDDTSAPVPTGAAPVQTRVPALRRTPDAVPDSSSSGPMPAHRTQSRSGGATVEEFHPSLKVKEDMDVSKIDPTLRTELLDKVRQVAMTGGSRNLFDFSKPPEPDAPKVTVNPVPVPLPAKTQPVKEVAPSGPPPPPPIPLKYYGYAKPSGDGKLRGMFLEGDPATGEFYIAGENELIKNRYRVVRIGVKAAELEDSGSNNNRQSMPLVEEQSQ